MNVLIERGNSALYDWFCADVEELKQFLKNDFDVDFYTRKDLEKMYFDCLRNDFENFKEEQSTDGSSIRDFKALSFNDFLSYILNLGYIDNKKMSEIFENNPNVGILSILEKNGNTESTFVDFSDKIDVEVAFYNLFGDEDFKIKIN